MDTEPVVEEVWAVFNDPALFEPRFASGQLHPMLREQLLETPLFSSSLPGAAKRFMNWTNTERAEKGGPDAIARDGYAILRHQTITRSAWRTVEGAELDAIEDGRRPNG